jgi:hypothetical protein
LKGVWLIVLAALFWGVLFFVVMLGSTGGHLSMPLDDSYIFFQYARQAAAGNWFHYQQDGSPSAGATSLLTVFLQSIGYLIGFRGSLMSIFALVLGTTALAWAGLSAWRLGKRLCPATAWLPPALLLLSGPLLWGFMSGMDLPVFVALALAFAARWPEPGKTPSWTFFVLGGLLGLARPDALFLLFPATVFGLRFLDRRAWWLLPWIGVALPYVLQATLAGSPQSASLDVKSVLSNPGFHWDGWIASGLSFLQIALKGILGGGIVREATGMSSNDGSALGFYIVPFALVLLVLGLAPGAWEEARKKSYGLHLLLAIWTVVLLLAVSFAVPRTWHWHRYVIPVYAFALMGIAIGGYRAGHWVEAAWMTLRPGDGARVMGAVLVLFSLPGVAYFPVAYGRNCSDIYYQHIELAQRFNEGRPIQPDLLGVHDAGALAYFGNYRMLDIEGLVSPEFRRAGRLGPAGVWEALERLAPSDRPDVLAVYPNWFGNVFLGPHRLVHTQRLFRPSIVSGNPMNVYLANWRLAGKGDHPRTPGLGATLEGMVLMAEVDVADLWSEEAAGYRYHIVDGAYDTLLRHLRAEDGEMVMDGGRLISGWEEFTVTGTRTGDRLVLVLRTNGAFRIRVETNGTPMGIWMQEGARSDSWYESAFVIPEGSITGESIRIRLSSDDPHHSAYVAFHYWVYRS